MENIGQLLVRLVRRKALLKSKKRVGATGNYIGGLEHGIRGSVALFAKLSTVLGEPQEQLYRNGGQNGETSAHCNWWRRRRGLYRPAMSRLAGIPR